MAKRCDNDECGRRLPNKTSYQLKLKSDDMVVKPRLCEMCFDNFTESITSTGRAVLVLRGKRLVFKDTKQDMNMFSFQHIHDMAKDYGHRKIV